MFNVFDTYIYLSRAIITTTPFTTTTPPPLQQHECFMNRPIKAILLFPGESDVLITIVK
jgi:hypothetical protein